MAQEIKIYLCSDKSLNPIEEIRRFQVSAEDYYDYTSFRRFISLLFPSLVKDFKIVWSDDEGDKVTATNQVEFESMKSMMKGKNMSRVYIVSSNEVKNFKQESKGNIEQIAHPGVVCDSCESDIYGYRYKCIQCADYDLCMQCEIQGMHQEHCLVRLSKPVKFNSVYAKRFAHQFNKFVNSKECPSNGSKRSGKCKQSGTETSTISPLLIDIDKTINETIPKVLKCWGIDLDYLHNFTAADQEKPAATNQEQPASTDQEKSAPTDQQNPIPTDQEKPISTEQAKPVIAEENKPSTSKESSATLKEDREKCIGEGWTLLNNILSPLSSSYQTEVAPTVPVQAEEAVKTIYPTLPNENKVFHPDPKIQRSVEAMMAMGFNNEGGWLTHLLASKNGDICKALDVLQPVRR